MIQRDPDKLRAWQARSKPLGRFTELRAISPKAAMGDGAALVLALPQRRSSRPKDTIPPAVRRLVRERDLDLCVHCGRQAEEQHHRRLKGMGGSTAAHANCPCVIVSLCGADHRWAHANRMDAEHDGLIIPRDIPKPWLLPVLVMSPGGSGTLAWPSCDGDWLRFEPEGGAA